MRPKGPLVFLHKEFTIVMEQMQLLSQLYQRVPQKAIRW